MLPQPSAGTARVGMPASADRTHVRTGSHATGLPLIVHADDFGETLQITAGICRGIEAGVITSTSIMANMPGTQDALQRVAALSDRASFGVHLNFCEGNALAAASSLTDASGRFHAKRALFLRSVTGRLRLADVEGEIAAQISRVHDAGVRISHVDGHKHLHQLPVISTAVANVLPRFAIQRVRITRLGRIAQLRPLTTLVREALAMKASRKFRRSSLRSPVRTLDLQPFLAAADRTFVRDGRGIRAARVDYPARLVDPAGPVELCCHPGTVAADVEKPGSHMRSAELEYLLSPRFRELLNVNRARLVSYWDV